MQKRYSRPQQSLALLITLVMFLLAPLSIFGQSPCPDDTEAPAFQSCPSDIILTSINTCEAATWVEPMATDNCLPPSLTSDYSSGFCFPIGGTRVTYTARDTSGNTATCSFLVTVTDVSNPCANDTEAPVFTNGCPTSITKDITDMTTTCLAAEWATPIVTDNCSDVTLTSNYASGYCFPVGLTFVTYTATDSANNTSTCSFAVVVVRPTSCAVANNTITKSCSANNIPVLSGSFLPGHEYLWIKSTTSCPTQASQAIPAAASQHYTLPSRVATTTYFIRLARPRGCITWNTVNQSNCITVNPSDCAPLIIINCNPSGINSIEKSCVNNLPLITGAPLADHEYVWYSSTTACPTLADLQLVGETGADLALASRPTVTTYYIRYARPIGCRQWAAINESNCVTINAEECINCTPTAANTITKSCVNNLPLITGTALVDHEYIWFSSTTACPTQADLQIVGATGANLALPSRLTATTYYIRLARPVGCLQWAAINESNCVTVNAAECAPPVITCNPSGNNTLTKSCVNNLPVITGTTLADHEYIWFSAPATCSPTPVYTQILGATGANLNLTSRPSKTTYYMRRARPIGCLQWAVINESNRISISSTECGTSTCAPKPIVNNNGCTKTNGCFTVVVQGITRLADNKVSVSFKVTNACRTALSHVAFALPINILAQNMPSVYRSSNGRSYSVENGTNNPYYSIKFNTVGQGIVTGQSDIFDYVLPANAVIPSTISVSVKAGCNIYGFIMSTTCSTVNSSLSSDYIDMTAKVRPTQVAIEWANNTGYKSDFFVVEKMNLTTGVFEDLAIKNVIPSAEPEFYSLYDENPDAGENVYRVGVMYEDGSTQYSRIQKVDFKPIVAFRAFPNPAFEELNINLEEYAGKAVDIVVVNQIGNAVYTEHLDNVANPIHPLNINDLASGMYLVRIASIGKRDATQQVMIQK